MTQLLNGRQVGSNHAHGWGVGLWEGEPIDAVRSFPSRVGQEARLK